MMDRMDTAIGNCGRCGQPVESQTGDVIDQMTSQVRPDLVWRTYLITNSPCGDAKRSETGNGSEALA